MIGEIGGPQEAEGAQFVRGHMTKPVDRLHRGPDGADRAHDGPRRRDRLGRRRVRAGEDGRARRLGDRLAPDPSSLGRTVARVLAEHDPEPISLPWSSAVRAGEPAR